MKRTALYSEHILLNAKMVPFAGYEMPVLYSSIREEHQAVRTHAGLFDVSHMANFRVTGEKAEAFLNHLTVNEVTNLVLGKAQYSAILNEKGGVLDDILIYLLGENEYQVIVNASNHQKIWDWFQGHKIPGVKLENLTDEWGILAFQGPLARTIFAEIYDQCVLELKVYTAVKLSIHEVEFVVSRTGYTGEDGLEIFGPASSLTAIWQNLIKAGVTPCGLGCRDTLRLEAGYSLYGHELSENWDPISSGIAWICPKEKTDFVGCEALNTVRKNRAEYKTVGIKLLDKAIPRQECKLFKNNYEVGVITSGSQSPSTGEFIAMGRVLQEYAQDNKFIEIEIRGKMKKAQIVNKRFYKG